MDTTSISILVATHNRSYSLEELLVRLIDMFSQEIRQVTTEILIFDDASTDDTVEICRKYAPYIHYLSTPHNVGLIEARRRLIAAAHGDYLVSLDDDSCFLDTNALHQIRETFRAHPDCAILAANIATPKAPAGCLPTHLKPFPVANFIGCGHILRAECVRQVGSYPDFLAGYGVEETILALRMLEAGYQIIFLPGLRIYHAEDWANSPGPKRRAFSIVNELAMVIYLYPGWLVLPALIKKTFSKVTFNLLDGHPSVGRMAPIALAAKNLPHVLPKALAQRRPIRTQTLKRFFALRKAFAHQISRHASSDSWEEVRSLFKTSRQLQS